MSGVDTGSISAMVTAYKGAAVLGRALASVDAQTFPPAEIIVVDDGSPDAIEPVVARFSRDMKSTAVVRYIRQQNTGVAGARNRGLQEARGAWVALLDQDDEWLPNHLERQLALARQQHANFVACDCQIRGLDGEPKTYLEIAGYSERFATDPPCALVTDFLDRLLRHGCFVMPSATLADRRMLLELGGFDPTLAGVDDYEMWMRAAPQATVAWDAVPTAVRWIHGQNVSSNHALMTGQHLRLWEKVSASGAIRQHPQRRRIVRRKLAQVHFDSAYFKLQSGGTREARRHLAVSMRLRPSLATARAWLTSGLPPSWSESLRQLRHGAARSQPGWRRTE